MKSELPSLETTENENITLKIYTMQTCSLDDQRVARMAVSSDETGQRMCCDSSQGWVAALLPEEVSREFSALLSFFLGHLPNGSGDSAEPGLVGRREQ